MTPQRKPDLGEHAYNIVSKVYSRVDSHGNISNADAVDCEQYITNILKQVKREVWSQALTRIETMMEAENESTDDQVWKYIAWLREQMKEAGS